MARLTPPRPLAAEDDRSAFDCGRDSLNQWFHRRAWHNQVGNISRTSIVCDPATGGIVGYVTLSAAQIEREYLPKSAQSNRPDAVPAILLGQLAIDRAYQGRGHAQDLLHFALTTALQLSKEIGCFGVITHPLDEGLIAFYRRFGFEPLPFDPRGALIVRVIDLEKAGFGD